VQKDNRSVIRFMGGPLWIRWHLEAVLYVSSKWLAFLWLRRLSI
jgi:hypothetical protein